MVIGICICFCELSTHVHSSFFLKGSLCSNHLPKQRVKYISLIFHLFSFFNCKEFYLFTFLKLKFYFLEQLKMYIKITKIAQRGSMYPVPSFFYYLRFTLLSVVCSLQLMNHY